MAGFISNIAIIQTPLKFCRCFLQYKHLIQYLCRIGRENIIYTNTIVMLCINVCISCYLASTPNAVHTVRATMKGMYLMA